MIRRSFTRTVGGLSSHRRRPFSSTTANPFLNDYNREILEAYKKKYNVLLAKHSRGAFLSLDKIAGVLLAAGALVYFDLAKDGLYWWGYGDVSLRARRAEERRLKKDPSYSSPLMRKFNRGQEDVYNLPLRAKLLAERKGVVHQPSTPEAMLANWDKFNEKSMNPGEDDDDDDEDDDDDDDDDDEEEDDDEDDE